MKKTIKGYVAGFLTAVLLTTLVLANTGVMREVFYGVNIVVNGVPWNPPSGMQPFISNGRTYLPVRGIAEALGENVEWYGPTQTVYIGNIPQGILRNPLWQAAPPFEGSRTRLENVNMLGNTYPNSFTGWGSWSHHNLNGQFSALSGTIGRRDGERGVGTITFTGDGRQLASFTIDDDTRPSDIFVDVRGVLVLRIEISNSWVPVLTNMIIE